MWSLRWIAATWQILFSLGFFLPSPPFLDLWSWQKSVKEGILLKQTSSFQRWKRRYFKLRGRTLYYAKDCKVQKCALVPCVAVKPALPVTLCWTFSLNLWLHVLIRNRLFPRQSLIFDEVDLSDASVAETSTKNINNSFTVSKSRFVNANVLND